MKEEPPLSDSWMVSQSSLMQCVCSCTALLAGLFWTWLRFLVFSILQLTNFWLAVYICSASEDFNAAVVHPIFGSIVASIPACHSLKRGRPGFNSRKFDLSSACYQLLIHSTQGQRASARLIFCTRSPFAPTRSQLPIAWWSTRRRLYDREPKMTYCDSN